MGNKADRSEIAPTDDYGKNPKISSTRSPDSLMLPGVSDHEDLSGIIRQKMIKRRSTDQMRPSPYQAPLFEVREITNSNNGSPKSSPAKKDSFLDSEACEVDVEPEETQLSRGIKPTVVSDRQRSFVFKQRDTDRDVGDEFEFGGNPSFVPINFKGSFALSNRQVGVSMKNLRVLPTKLAEFDETGQKEVQDFEYVPLTGHPDSFIRVDKKSRLLHSQFTGDLVHGVPDGIGTLKFSDTDYYSGSWSQGLAEGEGKLVTKELTYEGTFQQGKFSGTGTMKILHKGTYEGRFSCGQFDGKGKFTWACGGKIYVGTWKNGKFHGKGAMMWADGRKYCGEYQNGLKHGRGVCFFPSGKTIKGIWSFGRLQASS